MQPRLQTVLNCLYNRILPTLLSAVLLSVVWLGSQHTEPVAHDLFTRWSASSGSTSPVTLVLIDDDSLHRLKGPFGDPPWSGNAALILIQAMQQSHPALLGLDPFFIHDSHMKTVPHPLSLRGPFLRSPRGQSRLLTFNLLPGGIREFHEAFPEDEDGVIRAFRPGLHRPSPEPGAFMLRWTQRLNPHRPEPVHSHSALPLWRFLDKKHPPPDLSGRMALMGSASQLYPDYYKTPLANRQLGIDIQATAIDNLISGQHTRRLPAWQNALLLMLLCTAIFFIRLRYQSVSRTLLYTFGSMVIYSWFAFWCLATQGLWLDVITPLLFMLAAFMAASTRRISLKEKQLAHIEKKLSQLVDPEVFREIRRLSHVLVPGGQKLEITSMFVDIRDFTTLSEHLQPNELTEMLNEFYGETVKIIFSHQGTIDKFMGDGILIIFGAPLPQKNHREMALRATQDILQATDELCQRWRNTLGIDTDIGITLNSGPAFVGFVGPSYKLEYTGVGDTVNTCIRLQEQTKFFKTRLIISESTLAGLTAVAQEYQPLGNVNIRGRKGMLRVFTLPQSVSVVQKV